jgi:uncharacterized protein (UPF0210 family)
MKTAARLLIFAVLVSIAFAQTPAPKPKVRTICAFVRIDRNNYQQVVREAEPVLLAAKRAAEAAGYEVQTVRITTQPFPEYTRGLSREDAVAFLRQFDSFVTAEAKRLNINIARNIGPAMMRDNDDPASADVLAELLSGASAPDTSLMVAGEDGVHWRAVRAAAHVIKYAADHSPHSQGTFAFAATAMLAPFAPFYPGSYHTGAGKQFAIGIEGAGIVDEVFSRTREPQAALAQLTAALTVHAQAMEKIGREVAASSGWEYLGFDPTPAPLKDVSIGAAIEKFTGGKFGTSGTMTAASIITQAVKAVPVKQVGYSGLMLPVLEDARMAERWTERTYNIDSLLAYSAVCGTGLDTIPLPGDITEEQLARMIGDMAALAVKWHKPLTARLQPVAGKRAGERSEFDDPYLVNAVLQPLP